MKTIHQPLPVANLIRAPVADVCTRGQHHGVGYSCELGFGRGLIPRCVCDLQVTRDVNRETRKGPRHSRLEHLLNVCGSILASGLSAVRIPKS